MFSMLTQFYYIEDGFILIEDYSNDTVRTVFVCGESLYCVYDNWKGQYMVICYIGGRIDLDFYRERKNPVRVLIPTSWYFTLIL